MEHQLRARRPFPIERIQPFVRRPATETLTFEQLQKAVRDLPWQDRKEVGEMVVEWGQSLIDSAAIDERLDGHANNYRLRLICGTFPS